MSIEVRWSVSRPLMSEIAIGETKLFLGPEKLGGGRCCNHWLAKEFCNRGSDGQITLGVLPIASQKLITQEGEIRRSRSGIGVEAGIRSGGGWVIDGNQFTFCINPIPEIALSFLQRRNTGDGKPGSPPNVPGIVVEEEITSS